MSVKKGTDKDDVVHTHTMGYHSAVKEQSDAICGNVDGPRDSYTNKVRERQTASDISYMWNLKDRCKTQPPRQRKQTHGTSLAAHQSRLCSQGRGRGGDPLVAELRSRMWHSVTKKGKTYGYQREKGGG